MQGVGTIVDDEPRISISDARRVGSESEHVLQRHAQHRVARDRDGCVHHGQRHGAPAAWISIPPPGPSPSCRAASSRPSRSRWWRTPSTRTTNNSASTSRTSSGNVSILDGTGIGTITDNDLPPVISIDSITVDEGDSGQSQAIFTVSLSAASGLPVSVVYQTANGTAISPSDYTAVLPTTLTFAPGEVVKTSPCKSTETRWPSRTRRSRCSWPTRSTPRWRGVHRHRHHQRRRAADHHLQRHHRRRGRRHRPTRCSTSRSAGRPAAS